MIDDKLMIPMKRQGYIDMYNSIDVLQTRHYQDLLHIIHHQDMW